MSDIILFHFEQSEIRFVGTAEKPEWIAADICKVLEISNTSQALEALDDDERGLCLTDDGSLTGSQMLSVNQYGMLHLVMKSKKPAAKRFKRWVIHEVLPSIAKTGSYSINQNREKLESFN